MPIGESWHIKTRAKECHATGTPFADGDTIYAGIFPDPESSGYLRHDFSEVAWNARTLDDEQAFSFWRATYTVKVAEEKVEVVEKENAETLFSRMVEEDLDHTENTRFILAAMLERKKLLRETDTQRLDSGLLRVYEHRKTGEVFIIKDPQIPLDEVEAVQIEVLALLDPQAEETEEPTEEAKQQTSDQEPPTEEQTPDEELSEESPQQ